MDTIVVKSSSACSACQSQLKWKLCDRSTHSKIFYLDHEKCNVEKKDIYQRKQIDCSDFGHDGKPMTQTCPDGCSGCPICERGSIFRHVSMFPCACCIDSFSTKEELDEHILSQHSQCPGCRKFYKKRCHLFRHMRSSNKCNKMLILCSFCFRPFITKDELEKHIHTHQYKCRGCGKFYENMSRLFRHTQTHDACSSFCFPCLFCRYLFNSKEDLDGHMEIHRGNPFRCPHCGQTFSKKCSLTRHMRRYDAGFSTPPRCTKILPKDEFGNRVHIYVEKLKASQPRIYDNQVDQDGTCNDYSQDDDHLARSSERIPSKIQSPIEDEEQAGVAQGLQVVVKKELILEESDIQKGELKLKIGGQVMQNNGKINTNKDHKGENRTDTVSVQSSERLPSEIQSPVEDEEQAGVVQ